MAELEALIFDVDGTLADTERDGHRIAFNRAFDEAGLDWVWSVDLYGKLLSVTGGKERIRHYLEHFNRVFERPPDLFEEHVDHLLGLALVESEVLEKLLSHIGFCQCHGLFS